jgi:hypothetical protein
MRHSPLSTLHYQLNRLPFQGFGLGWYCYPLRWQKYLHIFWVILFFCWYFFCGHEFRVGVLFRIGHFGEFRGPPMSEFRENLNLFRLLQRYFCFFAYALRVVTRIILLQFIRFYRMID